MPTYIQHRVNTLAALTELPAGLGAEIDLRSDVTRPGALHLAHDPWQRGDDCHAWLDLWQSRARGPLILNTKEDGLEPALLEALAARGIEDFFFLDTQLPTLVRLMGQGLGAHLAVRLSAMEPRGGLEVLLAAPPSERPRIVWVDCFAQTPLPVAALRPLCGPLTPCLVSPELQGDSELRALPRFAALAALCPLICTKAPPAWRRLLGDSE